jgi:hypothetical protein
LNEAGKYNYDKAMEKLTAKGIPEELTVSQLFLPNKQYHLPFE